MHSGRRNRLPLLTQASILAALHKAHVAIVLIFIGIPIWLTGIMAFNDGGFLTLPIRTYSLRWFTEFFSSPLWIDALVNSLLVASGVAILATFVGTSAAYAFNRFGLSRRSTWYFLALLPLFMPGVVLGLGLLITFGDLLQGTRLFLVLAHSLWAMPLVFMVMEATFRHVDRRIIEASLDLGATPLRTFWDITMSLVLTGLVSSALFAFVVSLNEFIMALFLTTRNTLTLPVLMWQSLRSAGTPILAVASLILVGTVLSALLIVFILQIFRRRLT
ncbi:MAG TPA: ABC transporter permease [Alphaproteobacteria bacterium]|nr:ABC transporter permease [Alphaproteobacteria bacterium]